MCTLFQSLSFKQTQAGSEKESMVEAEKEEGEEEGEAGIGSEAGVKELKCTLHVLLPHKAIVCDRQFTPDPINKYFKHVMTAPE